MLGTAAGPDRATTEVTVYKSVGAAFLDAATARLAFEAARRARRRELFTSLTPSNWHMQLL